MPINIPDNLPAARLLRNENIFIMTNERAIHQDIRPLKIVILNLMPEKEAYELQLLRLLSNTPVQVDIDFIHPATHESKNTRKEHLKNFYKNFGDIKNNRYDGMIITGAPVETLKFEEVNYWNELKQIMDWSIKNVYSVLYICWGAQAALYHHYGIPKYELKGKLSGIYEHTVEVKNESLLRGFDEIFLAPQSRYTEVRKEDIKRKKDLKILSESQKAGVYIVMGKKGRQIFITGHPEYDAFTLKNEYERDIKKGLKVNIPENYFPFDDPDNVPKARWIAHANLLYSNWLNYYVYQQTPYNLEELED